MRVAARILPVLRLNLTSRLRLQGLGTGWSLTFAGFGFTPNYLSGTYWRTSANTTYYYRVAAYNDAGISPMSDSVYAKTRGNIWDGMSCNSTGACVEITDQTAWDACPVNNRFTEATCTGTSSCNEGENCDSDMGTCYIGGTCHDDYSRSQCRDAGAGDTFEYGGICPILHTLVVNRYPSAGGDITVSTADGSLDNPEQFIRYEAGTLITITATHAENYVFVKWEEVMAGSMPTFTEGSSTSPSITFNINGYVDINAKFEERTPIVPDEPFDPFNPNLADKYGTMNYNGQTYYSLSGSLRFSA